MATYTFILHKIPFKNKGKIKTFSDIQKLKECLTSRHIRISRNLKESPMGRRKMMSDGNIHLHKEIKSTGNDNYMHK